MKRKFALALALPLLCAGFASTFIPTNLTAAADDENDEYYATYEENESAEVIRMYNVDTLTSSEINNLLTEYSFLSEDLLSIAIEVTIQIEYVSIPPEDFEETPEEDEEGDIGRLNWTNVTGRYYFTALEDCNVRVAYVHTYWTALINSIGLEIGPLSISIAPLDGKDYYSQILSLYK